LLAAAVVQEHRSRAGEIQHDLNVRDQAAHPLVDQLFRDNAEPALRDTIRGSEPGDVFGVAQ
jgi:hypothetical protein